MKPRLAQKSFSTDLLWTFVLCAIIKGSESCSAILLNPFNDSTALLLFVCLSLISVCFICVSADFGWWACRFRKGLSVAEPACFWVDQSAGLSLADGHEYGPVHSRVHSKGRGRPAALTSGQWQVKGESQWRVSLVFERIHAELPPPKSFSHFSSGTRRVEPKRSFHHQEEAEGPAEGSGEAGETEREKREGGSTQWETTRQHRLRLLRDAHEFTQ